SHRSDHCRADLWPSRANRRPAQLGFSVLVDPRRLVHDLRIAAARHEGGGEGVHALVSLAVRGGRHARRATEPLWNRWPAGPDRGDARTFRGLSAIAPRAEWKRRIRAAR